MNEISNVTVTPLKEASNYVKPFRMSYIQCEKKKTWDLVIQKSSVAVIIYNKSSDKLILVKQFRPSVYATILHKNPSNSMPSSSDGDIGITLELCAGIVDKEDKTPKEIAQAEVMEECGYDVPLCNFEHVLKFLSGVGIGGANMHLFYTEVNDQMHVSRGGGLEAEGEMIEVIEMNPKDVESYLRQDCVKSPLFTIYGLSWFLNNKRTHSNLAPSKFVIALGIGVISYFVGMMLCNKV